MSKAFDKVNYSALSNKLMDRQVPTEVLTILITWYGLNKSSGKEEQHIVRHDNSNVWR